MLDLGMRMHDDDTPSPSFEKSSARRDIPCQQQALGTVPFGFLTLARPCISTKGGNRPMCAIGINLRFGVNWLG